MYSLDIVFKNIRDVISSVVIKYEAKGRALDTLETRKNYDLYKLSLSNATNFYLYDTFDKRALKYAGIPENDIENCYNNKENIPANKRDLVVYFQEKIIVNEFEEQNNYYRTFLGLPAVEDTDFVYVDINIADQLEIDYTTPIHKLTVDEINRLVNIDELNKIRAKYPEKEYLNFLGEDKIDIVTAREASNFSIIRMKISDVDNFYYDFHKLYSECREYFMSVSYIKENSSRHEYYDNFIGLMIMTMTIQRMFVRTFKYGIDRDFYDLASIKLLFDSYNVPFFEEIPISYQRILMKNLNSLLKYKSSDKVLYSICELLGFGDINILKFYLSKVHKMDSNGNPIFLYKEVMNEQTGEMETVYDYEKMFSFQWKTVELRERDVPSAMLNTPINESYESVVANDPFWVDDDDLRKMLYESEFNYVESKYLRMNLSYSLTSIIFDAIYASRMLADNREKTSKLTMKLPRIFGDKSVPIFNVIMLLTALVCKKNNFKGNIITQPSQVLSVLGFNFKADFKLLKEYIEQNERWIDKNVVDYFSKVTFTTAEDINNCYNNILELHKFISDGMRNATTKETYDAHKKLYDTLMITKISEDVYRMEDGRVASTYAEFLQDLDINAYAYFISIEDYEIAEIIDHITYQLSLLIEKFDFSYLNNDNNVVLNALIKLIDFFKSYTTDLESFNIFYISGEPIFNMIKLIAEVNHIHKSNLEKSYEIYTDKIHHIFKTIEKRDLEILRDLIPYRYTIMYPRELFKLYEKYRWESEIEFTDLIYYPFNDLINLINAELTLRDGYKMKDTMRIIYDIQN